MKKVALTTIAFLFAFAILGYADRCSELCNQCEKNPRDIRTCCQAENACYENGRQKCSAARGACKYLEGVGGNGDNGGNDQYFLAFNERRVRREVREGVDKAIRNYQQNFQNPQQPRARVGFGIL